MCVLSIIPPPPIQLSPISCMVMIRIHGLENMELSQKPHYNPTDPLTTSKASFKLRKLNFQLEYSRNRNGLWVRVFLIGWNRFRGPIHIYDSFIQANLSILAWLCEMPELQRWSWMVDLRQLEHKESIQDTVWNWLINEINLLGLNHLGVVIQDHIRFRYPIQSFWWCVLWSQPE